MSNQHKVRTYQRDNGTARESKGLPFGNKKSNMAPGFQYIAQGEEAMRFVIVGADAAGMSAASRAKRNKPDLEVLVFEQTTDVSYSA